MTDLVFVNHPTVSRSNGNWTVEANDRGQPIRLIFDCAVCHRSMNWVERRGGILRPQEFKVTHCGKEDKCPRELTAMPKRPGKL